MASLAENGPGQGEQPGAIRTAETPDGRKQVERLEKLDSRHHSYRYAMLSSPMSVKDYTGECRIRDEGDGTSTIVWCNDFRVVSGEESAVAGNIRQFLSTGMENLKRVYS